MTVIDEARAYVEANGGKLHEFTDYKPEPGERVRILVDGRTLFDVDGTFYWHEPAAFHGTIVIKTR